MPKSPWATLDYSNNLQARFPEDVRTRAVRLPGGVSLLAGTVLSELTTPKQNEVQTLTITATGGTYRLGVDGLYTTALAHNANAAAIQAAMDALIGSGNVVVAGTGPYTFTMAGDYSFTDVAMLLVDTGSLTGGSASMAETTKGSPGPGVLHKAYAFGETARCVLLVDAQTNAKGELIDQFGHKLSDVTVPAAYRGEFSVNRLIGLNSVAAAQLGRFTQGGNATTLAGTNEVQRVDFNIASTGGSLQLEFTDPNGSRIQTAPISWNATDATYLAAINSALNTASGVSGAIVASAISGTDTDLGFLLTFSGTGYTGRTHDLVRVTTLPTSSTRANVSRSTTGFNTSFIAGSILNLLA